MKRFFAALALALALPLLGAGPQQAKLETVLAAHDWINGAPSAADLRGKVVIVDVFTFGCYNCKNVTPNLQRLHARTPASQLAIVGVHSPETSYERERSNVVANLRSQGIVWPVAVDNDFQMWRAFGIEYWPTQLIFDKHGMLRKVVVGDSQDEEVDRTVAHLIAERP